jgi:hypothetical protein
MQVDEGRGRPVSNCQRTQHPIPLVGVAIVWSCPQDLWRTIVGGAMSRAPTLDVTEEDESYEVEAILDYVRMCMGTAFLTS